MKRYMPVLVLLMVGVISLRADDPTPTPGPSIPPAAVLATIDALSGVAVGALPSALPVDAWAQLYTLLGTGKNIPVENRFSKEREALIARAKNEGVTPALLQDCANYRARLNAALGNH